MASAAVMTDDMVDTAGTLVAGAEFLKERGAKKVFACATHGIFSPPAIERIEGSALDKVIVTDTVPIDPLTKPERGNRADGRGHPRRDDPQRLLR